MSDAVAAISDGAAMRLRPMLGQDLQTQVATALHARDGEASADRYVDPVSLGALVVAVAQFGWSIYRDLRSETPKPEPRIVARRIRIALNDRGDAPVIDSDMQRLIVDAVVSELVVIDDDQSDRSALG